MNARISVRRCAGLLIASVCLLSSAMACSSGGSSSTVKIVLQDYYGAPSPTSTAPAYLNKFVKNFSASHPAIQVERKSPASPNYSSLVLSQFAAGAQADLLMVDNPDVDRLANAGVLEPLDKLGRVNTNGINPNNLEETTYNGKLYGLPLYTNTLSIFYNKDILREAGITQLPKTWAQFKAAAKKATNKDHYGFVFAGKPGPGSATWQFEPWLWSNGGDLTDIDSPKSVQALNYLASLVKDGSTPKDVVNWTQDQPIQLFESGKAAFCENGLWNIPPMQSQFKKLHWGTISIPTRELGQKEVAPVGGEVWVIPKTTPKREKAAFTLLQSLSAPKNVIALAKGLSDVPTYTKLWSNPLWSGPEYQPFLAALRTARTRTRDLTTDYPQVEDVVGNAAASALIGKKSAADTFRSARSDVNKIIGN